MSSAKQYREIQTYARDVAIRDNDYLFTLTGWEAPATSPMAN